MNRLILASLFISLYSSLPTADHCYDFTSRTVNDACGSHNLSVNGELLANKIVVNNSPICNEGGCRF